MGVYVLDNQHDIARFLERVGALVRNGSVAELSEKRTRSNQQNNYLHLLIGYAAAQLGEDADYVKRQYYKAAANGDLYLHKEYDPRLKRDVARLRSSSLLTKEEMTLSIDRFRRWLRLEAGIPTPDASNASGMREMLRETSRAEKYL